MAKFTAVSSSKMTRRRVQYVVVVLTLLLIAALAVLAPLTWLQLGVLQPLTVPDVPAPE